MDRAVKKSTHQFHTKKNSYLKIFRMQCRKNIRVEDNKKRVNIAIYMKIYTNIYSYAICHENESK